MCFSLLTFEVFCVYSHTWTGFTSLEFSLMGLFTCYWLYKRDSHEGNIDHYDYFTCWTSDDNIWFLVKAQMLQRSASFNHLDYNLRSSFFFFFEGNILQDQYHTFRNGYSECSFNAYFKKLNFDLISCWFYRNIPV